MGERKDATIAQYEAAMKGADTAEEVAQRLGLPLTRVLDSLAILNRHGGNSLAGDFVADYKRRHSDG